MQKSIVVNHLKHFCLLLPFFFSFTVLLKAEKSYAYQLIYIQQVSSTEKSFHVRLGKADGINEGLEASFSTPYFSLVARAETVTREFSTWRVLEPHGKIPFEQNMLVVYHPSTERIWTQNPDLYFYLLAQKNREKNPDFFKDYHQVGSALVPQFLLEQEFFQKKKLFTSSLSVRAGLSQGQSQSVSFVNSSKITERQGQFVEAIYHYKLFEQFFIGGGFRQDEQTVDSLTVIVESKRQYLLLDVSYYLNEFKSYYTGAFYMGFSFGLGQSQTQVAEENLKGSTTLFPSLRVGWEFLLPGFFAFQVEGLGESVSIKESFSDGDEQTTNEVNTKVSLGLKKYF